MGTNFYLLTKNKSMVQKYAPYSYELTDEPDFGYKIHIAKTSCGWLPLFQKHDGLHCVRDIQSAYNTGEFRIFDEYGTEYNWYEFDERVLRFNGGTKGSVPREEIKQDHASIFYDPNMPKYRPISHLEYGHGQYAEEYYEDVDGYEFTIHEFC